MATESGSFHHAGGVIDDFQNPRRGFSTQPTGGPRQTIQQAIVYGSPTATEKMFSEATGKPLQK